MRKVRPAQSTQMSKNCRAGNASCAAGTSAYLECIHSLTADNGVRESIRVGWRYARSTAFGPDPSGEKAMGLIPRAMQPSTSSCC